MENAVKHIIAGTAGHIDHGKTALVRALTGIDTDRLEEEKRRGISIDIGFANLRPAPGLELGFVDVPGHERFIKNMLAGIGGIDVVLFVVAADESLKPQTREHFDICRLLGIRHGIVVLTKIDLADRDLVELVRLEVEEFVAGSFLEGAPVVAVSSRTGEGIEALKSELVKLADAIEPKNARHYFRMPVDRVFVMKGFGTVVTGTLIAGTVEKEAEVEIYPLERRARVRGIEVHNQQVERAWAGQRTALNLAGVESERLARGMVLAAPGKFRSTERADAVLDLLASAHPLKHRAPVHFHSGTAEAGAEVYLLEGQPQLEPGARGFVQMRLREPVLVLPGDRFIIRQFSPVVTIGGGVVLDNLAPKHRRGEDVKRRLERLQTGTPEDVLEALLEQAPAGLGLAEITARTGWLESETEAAATSLVGAGRAERAAGSPLWLVHHEPFRQGLARTLSALESFHRENPLAAGIAKELLRTREFPQAPPALLEALLERLKREGKVAVEGETVQLASHRIVLKQDETAAREKIVAAFEQAGLAVPGVEEVLGKVGVERERAQKILQILLRERVLVRVADGLVFHRRALESLKDLLAGQKKKSDRLSVPQFKDLTGISRKYAIPLLEFLDRERVTRRAGDERIIL
ncbi:MAG TPA: selenocysteine-specific translation elongation factor [Bryobacterales bacterium]|nr:selenocysteine-specific translation elongation factor [Bryobacterales bacterium]